MHRYAVGLTCVLFLFLLPASPLLAQGELPFDAELMAMEGFPMEGEEAPLGDLDEYVAEMTKTEGMFTYYTDEESRRVLLELGPDHLDQTYFLSMTLSEGTGDWLFTAPMMWGDMALRFHRHGENIEFIEPNYQYTTVMGEPMALAFESAFSDTIIGRATVEAESEEDGRVVIDLTTLLFGPASGIETSGWYSLLGGGYSIDRFYSYIENIQGFPENDEIDARLSVTGMGDPFGFTTPGSQVIKMHYSLSQPPDDGYIPRLADDRVGHFLNVSMNYSVETDRAETRYVRYVERWRLEKQDPEAEMSEPVEPIVFWLENTIPLEYRDAVREGVLLWNDAFQRIGYRNAIRVRQMHYEAEWDPADIRYNTIRWFVSPSASYAIGPSRADPRTGEIYDADVGVSADMLRYVFREYQFSVDPIRNVFASIAPPGWPDLDGRQVRWDENTEELLERQRLALGIPGVCDQFAAIHAYEGARAAAVLRARGTMEPGSPEEEEFIRQYIVSLIVHEVGHVLGLRHNFSGSAATPYYRLHNTFWTRQHGLSSSVMDYAGSNVAPVDEHQGEYFQTSLGDYDYWAIEYAYAHVDTETPEDELEALDEIARRAPQYRYGTDEDAYGWALAMDPDCFYWDLGDDAVRYHGDRLEVSGELMDRILEHWSEPGTRPVRLRNAFYYAVFDYLFAAMAVPRLIGGVRAYRDHIGDPDAHPAMAPVSADEQRRALWFLVNHLWRSEPFDFDPELVNMLGAERLRGLDWMSIYYRSRDIHLHDLVLLIQSEPFYWIYDSNVLGRVLNYQVRMPEGEEPFTLVELFDTVRDAIWSEVTTGTPIDSYRRNLQRAHLEMITGIILDPAYLTPEDAITLARRDLVALRDSIRPLIYGDAATNLDTMTIAHLEECLSRIELTLTAPMDRGGAGFPFLFLY